MPEGVYLSSPIRLEKKNIYSLIRRITWCHQSGMVASLEPLALVIEEEETWSFISLADGIDESVIFSLVASP